MNPRVLSVINQYLPFEGGAESLARIVVEQSNVLGVNNDVLTIGKKTLDEMAGTTLPHCETINGKYTIHRFRLPKFFGREKNGKIFRYITLLKCIYQFISLRRNYDIIHAHTFYDTTAAAIIAGKILHKPVIVTGHSTLTMLVDEIKNGSHPSFLLSVLKYADRYVAINESIRSEASEIAKIDPGKVTVINNGIDTRQYRPAADWNEKNQLRQKLNLPQERPLLIYHGRFEDYKNIQTLLKALAGVRRNGSNDFVLLLLGDGPYQDALLQLTEELHLMDAVLFLGFKKNTAEYLRASDIYCLPSFIEGLSLALLEAMASGLICIASKINGNMAAITDSKDGFLFPPDQTETLENILDNQLAGLNPTTMSPIVQNARKRVVEHFSVEIMAKKYVQLYQEIWSTEEGLK